MDNLPHNETGGQPTKKPAPDKHLVKMMVYELAMEFAFLIAAPIILLVYLGKWMDNKYDTGHYVILGFFLAMIISIVGIAKRINIIRKKLK